ncbi:unnamed protein product [Spirodela intermedia]|uniref:Uncharacterized protein n=2 Tax=Spirodela intermedia TaxID=51605 RepID=A0A7I8K823_SPIIN|nr:unnamed protein product [Spirodela intermedia]CAA6657768.1 unnamed protein product [Spirodela intermedia]CAA7393881.1 unnamed protein product [Spirodela intermedia]
MATISQATSPAAAQISGHRRATRYVGKLSSFGGLKAHDRVAALGTHECAAQSFTRVTAAALKGASRGKAKGGALSSTCNATAEIFRIAAIMNGLVLVGVAVGFVLLRVEASLEEAE